MLALVVARELDGAVQAAAVQRVMQRGGARLRFGASGVLPLIDSPPAGVESAPRLRACALVCHTAQQNYLQMRKEYCGIII